MKFTEIPEVYQEEFNMLAPAVFSLMDHTEISDEAFAVMLVSCAAQIMAGERDPKGTANDMCRLYRTYLKKSMDAYEMFGGKI